MKTNITEKTDYKISLKLGSLFYISDVYSLNVR